jgi:catalase
MVSHLLNIHPRLAAAVADGLGSELPAPAVAAQPTREDLDPSGALSIVLRGPKRFEGRKLGVMLTDGADAKLFTSLVTKIEKLGGMVEVVAPKISGVTLSDRTAVPAQQKIDGGPSVLYDAIAVIGSSDGATLLAKDAPAKSFVADAFAHCKFIGYSAEMEPLFAKAGVAEDLDDGCFVLTRAGMDDFIDALADLRFWAREANVDLDAQ